MPQNFTSRNFYFLALMLYVTELFLITLLQGYVLHLLLAWYIWMLFYQPTPSRLCFLILLMTSLSFITTGIWGIDLIYLIPFSVTIIAFSNRLYRSSLLCLISVAFLLLCRHLLFAIAWRKSPLEAPAYTLLTIGATLVVFSIFLKYQIRGKQDNRS